MKLLIVTQVVDLEHPVLGFFHRWIIEFAKHCEHVHVICLQEGKHDLPANVSVHSLGKEMGKGRLVYLYRFYRLIWSLRREYDKVFVHMNQEYVLLGGVLWQLLRKKVLMWRNHYAGSLLTKLAASFCHRIFYTSLASYTSRFKKSERMPIGLDASLFKEVGGITRQFGSFLYVGRVSESKRIHVIIQSIAALANPREKTLTIVGPVDSNEYYNYLIELAENCGLDVKFIGPVTWIDLPAIYSGHELCINMSPPGMFDKVIGESLLCGCDIVTTNQDLVSLLGSRVIASSVDSLSSYLAGYVYSFEIVNVLRESIARTHSLERLVTLVLREVSCPVGIVD